MIIPMVLGFIALFSWIVMLLWNSILPDVVHANPINFWQAMGLLVLAKILFGGFGGWRNKRHAMRERMHEKWQAMTPDERQKFKEEWKHRCNWRNRFVQQEPMPPQEKGTEPI
jgi:hypothetical protein